MTGAIDPRRTAADWFARKRSGRMTPEEQAELAAWLAASHAHEDALAAIELMWGAAETVRSDPAVLAIREEALRKPRSRWRMAAGGAIAACVVAVAGAGGLVTNGYSLLSPGSRTFSTSSGQTSTITLPDGSKVTLDANTILRARETKERRNLELVKGRAFFRVAKDPSRPFVVAARDNTVTAVGTAFDVALQPDGIKVTLLEGKVKVDAPMPAAAPARVRIQSTEMSPGSQLTAPDSGSWRVAKVDASQEVSWVAGQLVFAGRPLAQVVDEMNRRSGHEVVIEDPAVGRAVISGSFDSGDIDAFVEAVEAYGLARAERRPDGRIGLSAPGA